MSSSKMVNDRYRSALLVAKTAEVNAAEIGARLESAHPPSTELDQPRPDWPGIIRMIGRSILARAEQMVEADRALVAELDDGREPRERRDQARAALFERIGSVRGLIRGVYGTAAVRCVGLAGKTPTEPIALHRLAERVHARLDGLASRAPVTSGGTLDIPAIRDALAAEIASLGDAIADRAREARERETAQIAKDRAMAAHDAYFVSGARMLEGMFGIAGAHELAARVRPSKRRPGQVAAPIKDTPAGGAPVEGLPPGGEPGTLAGPDAPATA